MPTSPNISPTASKAILTPEAQALHSELKADGYGIFIGKKQYAEIVGCSTSAVDNFIAKGYGIPNYKKLGNAKNAKVLFSLRDVAEYIAGQTVRTA